MWRHTTPVHMHPKQTEGHMCGLAGIITPQPRADARQAVETMLAAQVHRGPDSAGTWAGDLAGHGVSIGLRRLRILDLSTTADQPMVSPDGRYALVFNGEIYNYLELRQELEHDTACSSEPTATPKSCFTRSSSGATTPSTG